MTITIEIPDTTGLKLKAAGISPEQAGTYIAQTLENVVMRAEADAAEIQAWWDSLSEQEREDERRRTAEGFQAIEEGRVTSLADAVARIRRRYAAGHQA